MKNSIFYGLLFSGLGLCGCTQVVTAPISIAGSVVSTTIEVTGTAVGTAVDIVTPDNDDKEEKAETREEDQS